MRLELGELRGPSPSLLRVLSRFANDLTEIATTRLFVCLIRLFVWSVFASGAFPPDGHAATPGAKIARLAPRRGGAQFLWEIDASYQLTDAELAPRKFLEIPSTHTYTGAVMN
jgi:hypothetical protein